VKTSSSAAVLDVPEEPPRAPVLPRSRVNADNAPPVRRLPRPAAKRGGPAASASCRRSRCRA
jgi:hypothetical protein